MYEFLAKVSSDASNQNKHFCGQSVAMVVLLMVVIVLDTVDGGESERALRLDQYAVIIWIVALFMYPPFLLGFRESEAARIVI